MTRLRVPTEVLVAFFLALLSSPAWAATVCYDESLYPSVWKLERTSTGLRAFLAGRFFRQVAELSPQHARTVLKHSDSRGWERDQGFVCPDHAGCLPRSSEGRACLT